jgi:hypothetical protein
MKISAYNILKYPELTKEVKYVILTADDSSDAPKNTISLDYYTD